MYILLISFSIWLNSISIDLLIFWFKKLSISSLNEPLLIYLENFYIKMLKNIYENKKLKELIVGFFIGNNESGNNFSGSSSI